MTEHGDHDEIAWKALLRANAPAPPVDEVDWTAVHRRLISDAAPLLRRRTTTWWQLLGKPSSRFLRTAAAAAAIAMLFAAGVLMPERPAAYATVDDVPSIEAALTATLAYASVPLLAVDADNDAVLDALLLYDREEW